MSDRKQWKDHHREALTRAIENLLRAAGCPTVDVHHTEGTFLGAPTLSVTIDFSDHEDDVVDGAMLWAIGVDEAEKLMGGKS